MITAVYLFLFIGLGSFFLYLGINKKQYFLVMLSGILFILSAINVYTGVVISDHVVNQTLENHTTNVYITTFIYGHELMASYISQPFAIFLILTGIAFLMIGLYYFYKNPDFDSGNNNED